MALQKQEIAVNFTGGMDTKTDPLQLDFGKFLYLQNMVYDDWKRLTKRDGYVAKGSTILSQFTYTFPAFGASVASGSFLSTLQNELIMGDGKNLLSYSDSNDSWVYKGRAESCSLSVFPVYQDQYTQILADSAINTTTGYTLYAWEQWTRIPDLGGEYRGIYFSILDNETKLTIYSSNLANTFNRPKCVSIGNFLYLIFFDTTSGFLKAFSVGPTAIGSTVTLANDINTTAPNYDAIINNSILYVGYNGTASTVKVASFSSALASIASASKSEVATRGVGIFADASNNIWVSYNNSSNTKAFILDSTLVSTVLAATVVDSTATALNVTNITGCFDGTRGIIFTDQQGDPALQQVSTISLAANFTQPAVGSTVTATFSADPLQFLGQIIFLSSGGYYYASGAVGSTDLILVNLGYIANAAPAATVTSGDFVYLSFGRINSKITYNTLTLAGTAGTPASLVRSLALNSKAFVQGGAAHVMASYDSPIQPAYFLCALYNIDPGLSPIANISAKVFDGEAGGIPYRIMLPSVPVDSSTNYNVALPKRIYNISKTSDNVQNLLWFNGVDNISIDLTPTQVSAQELGKTLLVGSGSTLAYDGETVSEQGFHIDPENVTATIATGSGFLSVGTYGYQIVYQWIDANGQIYKSAPSAILSIEIASSPSQVTLTIPTLRVTNKQEVTVTVYRTTANGSFFFRIDTLRIAPGAYPINNSVVTDAITVVDGIADTQLAGNQQLYTEGEVENIAPPGGSSITNFKSRAILLPFDAANSFWYSKQIIPGSPVEFTDSFIENVDSVGGSIIAAAPMDDKLIIYKAKTIYYMVGSGPAASGANNDFSEPLLITTDCGCEDKASIISMPLGHMFKSEKGIYLLDRSLQASYIGADVDDYNAYSVLSSKLIADNNQVLFSLSSGDTLMYDYFYKQWSVNPSMNTISDCIHNSAHTYLKSTGAVFQQTPGVYFDGASPVLLQFTTGWLNVAGLQGFIRAYHFYFLAQFKSPHTLTFNIYYDYDETVAQTTVITPTSAEGLEQWRVFLTKQKCEAFKINLVEAYVSGSGEGLSMSGLDLVVGLKGGRPRLAPSKSAG